MDYLCSCPTYLRPMPFGPLSTCPAIPIPLRPPRRSNSLPRTSFTATRILPRAHTSVQDHHSRRFFRCKPRSITAAASAHSSSHRDITHLLSQPGRGHNSFISRSGAHITLARHIPLPPLRNTQFPLRHHSSPIRKPIDSSSEFPPRLDLAYSSSSS